MTNLRLERLWIYFLTYSCLGWVLEVFFVAMTGGGFTNRGFLFGPYCPIYGIGCLMIIAAAKNMTRKPLQFILSSMIICGILEFSTSVIMEFLFHERWWDYSNFFFQIDGRVCLETLVPFGLLSYLVTGRLHPLLEQWISCFHRNTLHTMVRYSSVLFLADFITTLWRQFLS
ncbi:MAG: putative ABC transporter permease [Lachnospiraceae bacterium]|nr:putative ABC transporter permease [Candidatus Fimimorpha excrementavium]